MTTPIARGLVAWYRGGNNALDSSGNGNNGTWSGTEAYAAGKMGRAFDFDGSSSISTSVPALGADYAHSVLMWVRRTRNDQDALYAITAGTTSAVTTSAIYYRNTEHRWNFIFRGELKNTAVGNAPLSTWQHLALVCSGESVTFFVNGTVDTSTTATGTPAAPTIFLVGRAGITNIGTKPMEGQIGEFMFFSRALAAREIRAIMATGWPGAAI